MDRAMLTIARSGGLVALALLAPCSKAPPESMPVRAVAVEYVFLQMPHRLPAGSTTFEIVNEGGEGHDFILGRMLDETPIPEIIEAPPPERAKHFEQTARTASVDPGEQVRVGAALKPGTYAYMCLTTTEAGRTHAYHGMWGTLTVD